MMWTQHVLMQRACASMIHPRSLPRHDVSQVTQRGFCVITAKFYSNTYVLEIIFSLFSSSPAVTSIFNKLYKRIYKKINIILLFNIRSTLSRFLLTLISTYLGTYLYNFLFLILILKSEIFLSQDINFVKWVLN